MNVYPLKHYSIPQEIHGLLDDQYKKIQAAAIDMTDNLVVQAITQAAKEEGVTDLYLIDKKFAADAIKEKLEREDPKTFADKIRAMSDEELTDAIYKLLYARDPGKWFYKGTKECEEIMDNDGEIPDEMCRQCLLKKLQQPVEEG